jgi:hypothetical protein
MGPHLNRCLPWLVVALSLVLVPSGASGQYLYLDINRDQVCDEFDYTTFEGVADVYVDTAHNYDYTEALCSPSESLFVTGYQVLIRAHCGGLTVQSWSNELPGFDADPVRFENDEYILVSAKTSLSSGLAPGRYKLGTLSYKYWPPHDVCPWLGIAAAGASPGDPWWTGFTTVCPGSDGDHVHRLGVDFFETCGTCYICDPWGGDPDRCPTTAVESTTWGRIKRTYR